MDEILWAPKIIQADIAIGRHVIKRWIDEDVARGKKRLRNDCFAKIMKKKKRMIPTDP